MTRIDNPDELVNPYHVIYLMNKNLGYLDLDLSVLKFIIGSQSLGESILIVIFYRALNYLGPTFLNIGKWCSKIK